MNYLPNMQHFCNATPPLHPWWNAVLNGLQIFCLLLQYSISTGKPKCKYTNTNANTQIQMQIHNCKYKCTTTKIQIKLTSKILFAFAIFHVNYFQPFQLESPNANTQIQMQIHKYKNTNKMDFKYSVCFGNTPFQLESSACCRKAIVLRKEINPTNVFIEIKHTNKHIYL